MLDLVSFRCLIAYFAFFESTKKSPHYGGITVCRKSHRRDGFFDRLNGGSIEPPFLCTQPIFRSSFAHFLYIIAFDKGIAPLLREILISVKRTRKSAVRIGKDYSSVTAYHCIVGFLDTFPFTNISFYCFEFIC